MIELFCAKHGTAKASAPKWNREAIHSVTINRTGQCSDQTTNYLANFTNCFLVTISRRFSIPIEVTSSGEVKLKKKHHIQMGRALRNETDRFGHLAAAHHFLRDC